MGQIRQNQRRAIESFAGEPEAVRPPCITSSTQLGGPNGNNFYYAGISRGVGTCSDIHGMDVLVLSNNPPASSREIGELSCAYTVLVRTLTPEESAADQLAIDGYSRECIQLLVPVGGQDDGRVVFEPTGKNTFYTKLV